MTEWAELERFWGLMSQASWRFATSMRTNPHCYTLRKTWTDEADFVWAVEYIRRAGYVEPFRGRPYTLMDCNWYRYWTMGARIAETILINRKARVLQGEFDAVARSYDERFTNSESEAENRAAMRLVGAVEDLSVLDVGCGTGLFLEYASPRRYLGLDPSPCMLHVLRQKWPEASVLCVPLHSFVWEPVDLAVALFGVPNYLSPAEVERLPTLVAPGGRVVSMILQDDRTFQVSEVAFQRHPHYAALFPGATVTALGAFWVYDWRRP